MILTEDMDLMGIEVLEEGFLLKHIWNRITTANLSKHTFENTRAALAKTVAGITDPEDIQALRRDRSLGRAQMLRVIEKHPNPDERAEAKRHLAWLEGEYVKILSDRMKELKGKNESGPLTEMTFDLTELSGNGTTYACLKPATGETRRLLDLVVSTRPPFDPDTLRDEAHVTIVYSRNAQVDVEALNAAMLAICLPRVSARVRCVEYWDGHDKTGYAVLKLDSEDAKELNKAFIAAGAKHSFDDFQAHMTICSKVGPRTAAVEEWLERINRSLEGCNHEIYFDCIKVEDIKRD